MDKPTPSVLSKLLIIQTDLKAPKWQFNSFGKYKYRSCEDIMESVKPLLRWAWCVITISDEIINIWDRYYVKATASIIDVDTKERIDIVWYAREEESKKWMDWSQVTWASSSYARKYALNGLLAIDDTKDSDQTNTHAKEEKSVFTMERFEKFKEYAMNHSLEEITEQLTKIKETCTITKEVQEKLVLFVKNME